MYWRKTGGLFTSIQLKQEMKHIFIVNLCNETGTNNLKFDT